MLKPWSKQPSRPDPEIAVIPRQTSPEPGLHVTMDTIVKKLSRKPEGQPKCTYDYTVLETTEDYEKRWYPASTWVCTAVTGVYQDTAKIEAFRKLQSYVMGQNEAGAQLTMQAPILTRVSPQDGLSFDREFIVSAFLSTERSGKEPLPTHPDVFIDRLPALTVFVRSFQGMACEERWAHETRLLLQVLSYREDVRTDTYFTVAYGSPFQLVSSRNEVWMLEFNKHQDVEIYEKKQQFVQMGTTRLDLPRYLTWPLYFVLCYLYIVTQIITNAASAICVMAKNPNWVSECRDSVLGYVTQRLSPRYLSSVAVSSVTTAWKVTMGLIRS